MTISTMKWLFYRKKKSTELEHMLSFMIFCSQIDTYAMQVKI